MTGENDGRQASDHLLRPGPSACHGVDREHREVNKTEGHREDAEDEGRSAEEAGERRGETREVGSKGWIRPKRPGNETRHEGGPDGRQREDQQGDPADREAGEPDGCPPGRSIEWALARRPQTAGGSRGTSRVRANSRSADDAGRVAHRRRHERGVRLEELLVLGELPGEAAAEDDEVRPEIGLVVGQELAELAAPLLPAHLPSGARRAREAGLRVATVELDVSQLHVWYELPVDKERRADAGPEGQQQDHAGPVSYTH